MKLNVDIGHEKLPVNFEFLSLWVTYSDGSIVIDLNNG